MIPIGKLMLSAAVVGGILFWSWRIPLSAQNAASKSGSVVEVRGNEIGGVVTSAKGPEAGVWVIAETTSLPTKFVRIVVTDDGGRYLIPDLPIGTYSVWVRGYGLLDSKAISTTPGKAMNLLATVAPSPRAAAEIYPSSYWYSLMKVPPKSDFPGKGTGAGGNGIPSSMKSQEEWIGSLTTECVWCHQMGNKATREIPEQLGKFKNSSEAWTRRIQSGQWGSFMTNLFFRRFGQKGIELFADWTDRIAAGETPPAPSRPEGVERNVVITEWDWADSKSFIHDEISTDKRNPSVNAYGPVFGPEQHTHDVLDVVYPSRNMKDRVEIPASRDIPVPVPQKVTKPSAYWGEETIWSDKGSSRANMHNLMMDQKARVWTTTSVRGGVRPEFCKAGSSHPSAAYFPFSDDAGINGPNGEGRQLSMYDPATKRVTLIDTCYNTHHLQFGEDQDNTLWTSGGGVVIGYFKTKIFDETHDAVKAQNWCPLIVDTNGNGRADAYVGPDDPLDPTKDKLIRGGGYGIVVNPVDGSVWTANSGVPGSIVRLSLGANPPRSCLTEIYEPPFRNPQSATSGFSPRGIDIDRNGLIWTALAGSGQLASFDRRKCKVLNGPTATGQHCPEGWTLYELPGPKFRDSNDASADMHYYNWVDQFDTFGLGENVPYVNGTGSDSLMAFLPKTGKALTFRVPYPLGFYSRGMDGRIDDPNVGWKGRGLWANFGTFAIWHVEGGKGQQSKVVKFQLRPDPLAR